MKSPLIIIVGVSLALTVVGLVAAVASAFGHRLDLWGYMMGFKILTVAVIGAGIGVVAALVGIFLAWRGGHQAALYGSLAAFALGLILVVPSLSWVRAVRQLPYIHDITTDTGNPPEFAAILKERADAPNTAEYGGPEIAKLQEAAYPDIKPLHLRVPPSQAFEAALKTAQRLGWKIVGADAAAGRIEASDQTFWYGFIDDVVIRVTPLPEGARVDVRSVSRVGKSDVGTNARRIRDYLEELRERVGAAAVA